MFCLRCANDLCLIFTSKLCTIMLLFIHQLSVFCFWCFNLFLVFAIIAITTTFAVTNSVRCLAFFTGIFYMLDDCIIYQHWHVCKITEIAIVRCFIIYRRWYIYCKPVKWHEKLLINICVVVVSFITFSAIFAVTVSSTCSCRNRNRAYNTYHKYQQQ